MKKTFFRLMSLALVFALLLGAVACSGGEDGETTTTTSSAIDATEEIITPDADLSTTADASQDVSGEESQSETTVAGESTSATEAQPGDESTTAAATTQAANKKPATAAEILAAYTAVMNQAKKDKPAFKKIEYQTLPDDAASRQIRKGEGLLSIILNVASNFMTTEADAKANPGVFEKGNDMNAFPLLHTDYGCLLTDTSFIKSAKCEELANGNYKITIITREEENPEPIAAGASKSPSKTGEIFAPLSRKDIDNTITGNSIVTTVARDLKYNLTYHDCKAVVVYNPDTNRVVSFEQYMYVTIVGSGNIILMGDFDLTQELVNTVKIYDVKY